MSTTLFTDAPSLWMSGISYSESVVLKCESTFINDVAAFYQVVLNADRLTTERDLFFSYVTSKNLSEKVKT